MTREEYRRLCEEGAQVLQRALGDGWTCKACGLPSGEVCPDCDDEADDYEPPTMDEFFGSKT